MKKNFFWFLAVLLLPFLLSCKGGSGGQLDDLAGGDLSDVDRVTITQFLPSTINVTVEQAQTQNFFVTAEAPPTRSIKYTWIYDGSVVQTGSTASYSVTGGLANIGTQTLKIEATDGETTDSVTWNVKVNGPPEITPITTGTPKVSVSDTTNISASVSDPNGDALSYVWTLNGLPNAYLSSGTPSATLTGHASIVGSNNITLTVSDGTASDTYTWTAEVNYFPSACNNLSQGEICTIGGNPSIGDGENPSLSQQRIRIQPIAVTVDDLGNHIFADYPNHVIWYWNKTGSDVTKFNVTIPAGQIKVIAGTGEGSSGSDGLALQSPLYYPRGLAYDAANNHLYIAEWSGSKIKRVDQTGIVSAVMGMGNSNVDGELTINHRCSLPADIHLYNDKLYVACYNDDRVKEADLNTGTTTTIIGNSSNGLSASGTNLPGVLQNPMGVFANADGVFATAWAHHYVIYANTSGVTKNLWGISAEAGKMYRIMGDGTAGENTNVAPTSAKIAQPSDIYVIGENYFVSAMNSNREGIWVVNNTGATQTYGNHTVNDGIARRLTYHNNANNMRGYNGSGIDHDAARVWDVYKLFYDSADNAMVFADYGNNRLRKLDFDDYKVYDLVGSGRQRNGFVGDVELPTTTHLFNYPSSLAFEDSTRTLFFMDNNNYRVRKLDPYGQVSTAMGRGRGDPSIDNDIPSNVLLDSYQNGNSYTSGVAVFSDGVLAQVNSQGHNIRAWNRTGSPATILGRYILDDSVSTFVGDYLTGAGDGPTGPAIDALLNYPTSIVGVGSGVSRVLYISDTQNHCIRRVDNAGNLTTVVGVCGDTSNGASNLGSVNSGILNQPYQVAVDSNGNLIIADYANHKIRYANIGSSSVTVANVTIPAGQVGTIACNNGTTGDASENILSIGARCHTPMGVATYGDNICYSSFNRHNVRCFTFSTGLIQTVAGALESSPRAGSPVNFAQEGVPGTDARLYRPVEVTFDNNGDLYIVDKYNHIIRKLKLSN